MFFVAAWRTCASREAVRRLAHRPARTPPRRSASARARFYRTAAAANSRNSGSRRRPEKRDRVADARSDTDDRQRDCHRGGIVRTRRLRDPRPCRTSGALEGAPRRAFSALDLAIALESYAGECASAIGDSETYVASGESAGRAVGNVPELPDYVAVTDWKSLGIKPTTSARTFRVEVEATRGMISGHWEFGDEEDVVPMVREEAARLGVKALELAVALRKRWKIALPDDTGEWNVADYLASKLKEYRKKRLAWEERQRIATQEMMASMPAVQESPAPSQTSA
jgi:hypothetical protein